MEARFHLGWVMTLVYAAGGIFLVFTGTRQERTPLLLMGLGALLLGLLQGWLCVRKGGQDGRRHANVLLGPAYALIGIFWLHDGFSTGNGRSIGFGLVWLGIAASWIVRVFRELRESGEEL